MKVSTFLFKTEHLNNLAPQSTLEFQIPKCEWYLKRLCLGRVKEFLRVVTSAKLSLPHICRQSLHPFVCGFAVPFHCRGSQIFDLSVA